MVSSLTLSSLTLHSLSLPSSIRNLTCTSLSYTSSFPNSWAHELAEQDELLTTFGEQEMVDQDKLRRTDTAKEIEKHTELPNLLWDRELAKHLADKSSWVDQLQQNLSEDEKNKELDKNKKLEEKNFEQMIFKKKLELINEFHQSLIFKKLVALLLEEHFASATSSQLLGNEAWEKYREASEEISFDNVRGKELSQELRREQRDRKDLRSASFRALCPSTF